MHFAPALDSKSHLIRLDILRATGALLVLYSHFLDSFAASFNTGKWPFGFSIISEGKIGVAFFCVISGFIFEYLVRGQKIDYKNFMISRLWRIYPLYVLTLVFALYAFHGTGAGLATQLLAFVPTAETGDIWAPTWSIVIEFQFYLIFPFLSLLLTRFGIRQMLAIIALFLVIRLGLWDLGKDVNMLGFSSICGRMDQFLGGMIAARLYYQGRAKLFAHPLALLVSFALLATAVHPYHRIYGAAHPWMEVPMTSVYSVAWPTIQSFVFSCLTLSFLQLRWTLPRWFEAPLAYLGRISFSIYLLHRLVEFILGKHLNFRLIAVTGGYRTDAILLCTLVELPIVVALASLAYFAIEGPFQRFKRPYLKDQSVAGVDQPIFPCDRATPEK